MMMMMMMMMMMVLLMMMVMMIPRISRGVAPSPHTTHPSISAALPHSRLSTHLDEPTRLSQPSRPLPSPPARILIDPRSPPHALALAQLLLVDTSVRAADPSEPAGRLARPSMIIRLRPLREAARDDASARATTHRGEGDHVRAREAPSTALTRAPRMAHDAVRESVREDWEGLPRAVLCEAAAASAQGGASAWRATRMRRGGGGRDENGGGCEAYRPSFRCAPCEPGGPCPALLDIFPPPPTPSYRHEPATAPLAEACAACCLARTCATNGCKALAGVVPTDSSGNVFAARLKAPSVLQRTGRYIACHRVRSALCAAGAGRATAGLGRAATTPHASAGVAPSTAHSTALSTAAVAADVRLLVAACALNTTLLAAAHGESAADVGASDPPLMTALVSSPPLEGPEGGGPGGGARGGRAWRLGEGAPPSMQSAHFFSAEDRRGWLAYFALQLHEELIVRRLLQALNAPDGAAMSAHEGGGRGRRSRMPWHEALCRAR